MLGNRVFRAPLRTQFGVDHLIVLLAFTSVIKRSDFGINLLVGFIPKSRGLVKTGDSEAAVPSFN
jgi:hypothetical protein